MPSASADLDTRPIEPLRTSHPELEQYSHSLWNGLNRICANVQNHALLMAQANVIRARLGSLDARSVWIKNSWHLVRATPHTPA
jgi:hypothetical protein